jgi:hypothetical protein
MLFKEIITIVYSQNNTKHLNTFCRQNEDLVNVIVCTTYSYHCALKG